MRILLFFVFFQSMLLSAQEYSFVPKEYHVMTDAEKDKLVPPFKGVSFLMEDGKYLENKDVAAMKASGGYEQIYYGDKKGNVRIIVTRKLSEQEKQQKKADFDKLKLESEQTLKSLPGNKLPDLKFTNLDGSLYELPKDQKPLVLYFWFAKCEQCQKVVTEINRLQHKFDSRVNFVSPTLDKQKDAEAFLKTKKLPTPVHIPGSELRKQHIDFFPTVILVDANGTVVFASKDENLSRQLEQKLLELSK